MPTRLCGFEHSEALLKILFDLRSNYETKCFAGHFSFFPVAAGVDCWPLKHLAARERGYKKWPGENGWEIRPSFRAYNVLYNVTRADGLFAGTEKRNQTKQKQANEHYQLGIIFEFFLLV